MSGNKELDDLLIDSSSPEQSKEDIRKGNTGPITIDELLSLHKGLLKQQQLWNYIAQLIEKDNGK